MSYEIENLKFTIFGHGHDVVRNDSGDGSVTWEKSINLYSDSACIDNTESYVWFGIGNQVQPRLRKYNIDTFEMEQVTTIPTNLATRMFHPSNVENNYGIAFQNEGANTDIYIFDLTTDEIYQHFNADTSNTYINYNADCIMVDDVIYFSNRGQRYEIIIKLDMTNETITRYAQIDFANGASCGFVDDDTVYGYTDPLWFSNYAYRYGFSIDGTNLWTLQGRETGGGGFPHCYSRGLCGNGYMWLPVEIDGKWHWGSFDGNSGGDLYTPTPISIIGEFENDPEYTSFNVYYADGRNVAVSTGNNYLMTVVDFEKNKVYFTEQNLTPLAVSNKYLVATSAAPNVTKLIRYR